MKNKKVAIYARTASRFNADHKNFVSQVKPLKKKVAADGLKVDKQDIFSDEGVSGVTLVRTGLDTLLSEVRKGKFNKLYVYDLTRLSRNIADSVVLEKTLNANGVEIVYLH